MEYEMTDLIQKSALEELSPAEQALLDSYLAKHPDTARELLRMRHITRASLLMPTAQPSENFTRSLLEKLPPQTSTHPVLDFFHSTLRIDQNQICPILFLLFAIFYVVLAQFINYFVMNQTINGFLPVWFYHQSFFSSMTAVFFFISGILLLKNKRTSANFVLSALGVYVVLLLLNGAYAHSLGASSKAAVFGAASYVGSGLTIVFTLAAMLLKQRKEMRNEP